MTQSNEQVTKSQENPQVQRIERPGRRRVFTPAVDIIEKPDEILLRADLPGVNEKSIDCTLEAGILTIKATTENTVPSGLRLIDGEFVLGDFERAFSLSEEIDQDKIRASVKNGVMELHLPKAQSARARKIEINVE